MGITAFIGGGNMATALIGGLRRGGLEGRSILVIEPDAAQCGRLAAEFEVQAFTAVDAKLREAERVIWAVKPQAFRAAAAPVAPHAAGALHVSVMAGIRSDAMAHALGTERIVRAMPNTPALIGQGIAGLYARPAVDAAGRASGEAVLAATGRIVWVGDEADLDAVTALSGSGPAYVFYVAEAMVRAATEMGLEPAVGRELALATFAGAAALAQGSAEPLDALRARVTSKGGTTHAAVSELDARGVAEAFVAAVRAAQVRAQELGDAFG
jgi:pyrroline-5-carboxylate reductase